ncbi:MAG: hypothetical protein D6743_17735 [Calditrichaeota bacterium]|nr:MAG: hypothetical protein D6743_17735 [Calditrichota bacterium]
MAAIGQDAESKPVKSAKTFPVNLAAFRLFAGVRFHWEAHVFSARARHSPSVALYKLNSAFLI